MFVFAVFVVNVQAVPGMINYQGKVDVSDQPFSGNGNFRFAIVNGQGSTNYLWSNDGNFPPTTNVQEAVENGIYNVILGNTPMTTIPTSVFENNDIYLRVWFNDGTHGLQQLAPDQKITSTGFAIKAEDANTLQGHASSSFANSTHSHSFTNITGTATDTQTPDTHTHAAGSIPAFSINATGLDSDTVDGAHADQFLRSDQSDTMNGSLTVSSNALINNFLGIGTTSPTDKLSLLNGEMSLIRTDGGESIINFGDSLSDPDRYVGRIAYNHSENRMSLCTNNGGPDLSVWNDNVGIGTTAPPTKLAVQDGTISVFSNSDPLFGDLGGTLLLGPCNGTADAATGGIFSGWCGISNPTIGMYTTRDGTRAGYRADYSNSLYLVTSGQDRVIVNPNGLVGIGTITPCDKFTLLNGEMSLIRTDGGESIINFGDSLSDPDRYVGRIAYNHSENRMSMCTNGGPDLSVWNESVGIGTTAPVTKLVVYDGSLSVYNSSDPLFGDNGGTLLLGPCDGTANTATGGIFSGWKGIANPTIGMFLTRDGHRTGFRADYSDTLALSTGGYDRLIVNTAGCVGINVESLNGYQLQVEGNGIDASAYHCRSGDIAEKLAVHPDYQTSESGDEIDLEKEKQDPDTSHSLITPGTVVVITSEGIVPCSKENDTSLAGIISTEPAIKMARAEQGEYVALAGKVPCKVTGKISAGDMLTTAEKSGHAQRVDQPKIGAVVGKALEDFEGENGVIDVWIGGF